MVTLQLRRKSTAMISAAATSLLLFSGKDRGVRTVSATAHTSENAPFRRPPQPRVRTARRQVPYPNDHPLGRHLNEGSDGTAWPEEGENEQDGEGDRVVAPDGSRSSRLRDNQSKGQQSFFRVSNRPKLSEKRKSADPRDEPEVIREGRLVRDGRGETLRYWTISGRNLATAGADNVTDSTQLLMGAGQIRDENEERKRSENPRGDEGRESRGEEDKVSLFDPNYYQDTPLEQPLEEEDNDKDADEEPSRTLYQPIRLRAVFTDDETSGSRYLTPSQRQILMEDILNPALFGWSQALHVVPVAGRLTVDRTQLYDGVSCGPGLDSGLPSVRVPPEHTAEGLADTDTVVYVSVAFAGTAAAAAAGAPGPSRPHHRPDYAGGGATRRRDANETAWVPAANGNTERPSAHPSAPPSFPPSGAPPLAETRSAPACPGTYLAAATYCSTDQHDRPVAGLLSLCIADVHGFFHNPEQVRRQQITVMHELGHVLGFNAQSLAHFRDPDTGRPLTPRDGRGDVPDILVECTGPAPRLTTSLPLPASNIIEFRSVRGGVRAATVVTPTVRRVARNALGCHTLAGAELESAEGGRFGAVGSDDGGPLSPGDCLGDHWARRLFREDLMNPIVGDVPFSLRVSALTLAYFADSGWYRVDAGRVANPSKWGRNAGCHFAEDKCIGPTGEVHASNGPFFCNNFLEEPSVSDEEGDREETEEQVAEIHGCDLDYSRKAQCSLVEYEEAVPSPYDYFTQDEDLDRASYYGGSDSTLDYCPVFEGFANGRCDDEKSKDLMQVRSSRSSLEVFGEVNSRCVIGHVDRKRTALCLPVACVMEERSLMVKVDGYWKPCSYGGQIMSVWWNPNDYVVCPDPSRMCPTFYCPDDCLREGGICDYHTGQCMCATPKNSSISNTTSWFSGHRSYQRFVPCSGTGGHLHAGPNFQIVERMNFELPDYYVENTTVLMNDKRDFDEKISRMFINLSTGEVISLVTSFMLCAIIIFILWSHMVKCYKSRPSLVKVRSSFGSLLGISASANHLSLDIDRHDGMDTPPPHTRQQGGRNPQKDKMIATLLVQMRTQATAEQEQQQRLQLGGLIAALPGESDFSSTGPIIAHLSSSTVEDFLVRRSELPTLPEGRIMAVVGAQIVEDEGLRNEDGRSSVTATTTDISETASPLYQDVEDRRNTSGMLRLRRYVE